MTELTFKVANGKGFPLPNAFMKTLYLSSLNGEPFKTKLLNIGEGCITLVPPSETFQAVMVIPVQGFGSVYVYADNKGTGFAGSEKEIDLCFEAAKTRLAKVHRWIREQERTGFSPSDIVEDKLNAAEKRLKGAERAGEGSRERSAITFKSLRDSLWAGETVAVEKAQHDIVAGGWKDGFLFGCNCFGHPMLGRRYDELFLEVFNYATVPFYWSVFEPHRGDKGWDRNDELALWLTKSGVTAKDHPLVWFHSFGIPEWTRGLDYETLKSLQRDRVYEIVEKYRGTIDIFDVINEAHDWANELGYTHDQLLEMTKLACDATAEANAEAIRVVNNCCIWGEYSATDATHFGRSDRPLTTPYRYLEKCIKANIGFEVLGLQLYYPVQDMFEISLQLDRFARLGKPIHITELGISSANRTDPNAFVRQVNPFH